MLCTIKWSYDYIILLVHVCYYKYFFAKRTSMCSLVVFLMPRVPARITCGLKTLPDGAGLPVSAGTWPQQCVCFFAWWAHE